MDAFEKIKQQSGQVPDYFNQKTPADPTIWYPHRNIKTGQGYAVVRLLRAPAGEAAPIVTWFEHNFKKGHRHFVERCPTSLGKGTPCPVCELNAILWKTGNEEKRMIVRQRSRKQRVAVNVYVITDDLFPESVGTVRHWTFGKKIAAKIHSKLANKVNVFDLSKGCNFAVKTKVIAGYPNYDDSEFQAPCQLDQNEEKMKAIWQAAMPLQPLATASMVKPCDVLKEKLARVLGVLH